jgi:hypothetical protein
MKLFGKEFSQEQIGRTSLIGYVLGYLMYYVQTNYYVFAIPMFTGVIAGFIWLWVRHQNKDYTFGYWTMVLWQAFISYNMYLGFISA